MSIRLTKKQKREFIEIYLKYRADGVTTVRNAYQAARMEMASANKLSPSFRTLQYWLRNGLDQAMSDVPDEADPPSQGSGEASEASNQDSAGDQDGVETEAPGADQDSAGDQDGVETEAPETDPEAEAEDQAEDPEAAEDYTSRLEMMVRLYRRRSERDVDAVCDRLLPELATEEE